MDLVVKLLEDVIEYGTRGSLRRWSEQEGKARPQPKPSYSTTRIPDVVYLRTNSGDGVPPGSGDVKSRKRPYVADEDDEGS